jgi:hypothetical protein
MFNFKYTPENIADARRSLHKGLKEKAGENKTEYVIPYWDVSKAFPGGPHSNNFEIKAIDQKALKKWASENGFKVSFLREDIEAEWLERRMPPVLFRKLISK